MTAGPPPVDLAAGSPFQQGRTQQLWQVPPTRADGGDLVARGRARLQNVELPRGS
jgi:acyl-coenzyme A thioesterase PaaI-like protein